METIAERSSTLLKIRAKAKEILPQGAQLWLYGSRARGDARPDSDWDLLILLEKDELDATDYPKVAHPFVRLGWDIGQTISAQTYTKEYWAKHPFLPFVKNVEQDKIPLT